jgi:hypothetical protein
MECFRCNKRFKSKQNLQYHLDKKIKCDTIYECERCKTRFITKYNLDKHIKSNKCATMSIEDELKITKIELANCKQELLDCKLELLNLKHQVTQLSITNNITGNVNNGIIINNQINIFGHESIEHITKKVLEREILKIAEREYDECHRKKLKFKTIVYPTIFIKMIDVHLLLTKLIYFTKKKNNTMKKENNKYYINGDEGWEEVGLEQIHIKTYTKHQEVLVQCKTLIVENKIFRKAVENYFGLDDDFKLKIETGKIEFILSPARYKLLNELLDYELDHIDNLEMNHINNIIE